MYDRCTKGKRSESEKAAIAAQRKADADAIAKKAAEEAPPGPNEGRLLFRICPFFEHTAQSVARVTATHVATGQVHTLDLDKLIRIGEIRSEFAFKKVPLGTYEVTADYGVAVGATRDVMVLKCDRKAKPCKDGRVRTIEVVPAAQEVPPKLDKDGKPEKRPCDWVAGE